ncbi:ATP-binding protein [Actinocorallia aurea]
MVKRMEEVPTMSIVHLPHSAAGVSAVRRRLGRELLEWGVSDEVADDAAVIASELMSNALRHARPLPGPEPQIKVSWARIGDIVELSVSDGGAITEPRKGQPALSSLGGRGLGIVETLSQAWGVRRDDHGSTVWAHLHAPAVFPQMDDVGSFVKETGTPLQNLS